MLGCKVFEKLLHSNLRPRSACVCIFLLAQLLSGLPAKAEMIRSRTVRKQGQASCEDEERLRQSPPSLADVLQYGLNVFKEYLRRKEQDKAEYAVAVLRTLCCAMASIVSLLEYTSNKTFRTLDVVSLLVAWTTASPYCSMVVLELMSTKTLPESDRLIDLSSHLQEQSVRRPNQKRLQMALQVLLEDGMECAQKPYTTYLTRASFCFKVGLCSADYLKDSNLRVHWKMRLLDQICPCLERIQRWNDLGSVRSSLIFVVGC